MSESPRDQKRVLRLDGAADCSDLGDGEDSPSAPKFQLLRRLAAVEAKMEAESLAREKDALVRAQVVDQDSLVAKLSDQLSSLQSQVESLAREKDALLRAQVTRRADGSKASKDVSSSARGRAMPGPRANTGGLVQREMPRRVSPSSRQSPMSSAGTLCHTISGSAFIAESPQPTQPRRFLSSPSSSRPILGMPMVSVQCSGQDRRLSEANILSPRACRPRNPEFVLKSRLDELEKALGL